MPKRIQLRRAKGWRKPAGCVSVGRGTRWGNPFKLDGTIDLRYIRGDLHNTARSEQQKARSQREVAHAFHLNLLCGALSFTIADVKRELRGKDLACWCKPGEPCHAEVLLAIANE